MTSTPSPLAANLPSRPGFARVVAGLQTRAFFSGFSGSPHAAFASGSWVTCFCRAPLPKRAVLRFLSVIPSAARNLLFSSFSPLATRHSPLLLLLLFLSASAHAGTLSGTVINRTTGKPEPNVALDLLSPTQGMAELATATSDAQGHFSVTKDSIGMAPILIRATFHDVSFNTFAPGVAAIYLANAYNFPDALGGAAAAGTLPGPVLLVGPNVPLDPATLAEIERLTPQHIYVLGGTGVVSDQVFDAVSAYPTGP